jgi:hypothetical protein
MVTNSLPRGRRTPPLRLRVRAALSTTRRLLETPVLDPLACALTGAVIGLAFLWLIAVAGP